MDAYRSKGPGVRLAVGLVALLAVGLAGGVLLDPAAKPVRAESGPGEQADAVQPFLDLIGRLERDAEAWSRVRAELLEQIEALRAELDAAPDEAASAQESLEASRARAAELERQIAELSAELDRAQEELSAVETSISEISGNLDAAAAPGDRARRLRAFEEALRLVDALKPAQEDDAPPIAPEPGAEPSGTPRAATQLAAGAPGAIDFDRDIRPILSDNCFACHGPDAQHRQAGLRLDTQEGLFSALRSSAHPIVANDRSASAVYQRISADDPLDRMPPANHEKSLTPEEIELIGQWIDEGAVWKGHWAFEPVQRHAVPEVEYADWPRNDIDRFILSRLEREGLEPAPEADRNTLIRRVTLDLTGLPPTPEEVEAFVNDPRPDAYERLVDRLLASPRYGEHMARYWLDIARYSDTNGYHIDNERYMWRWRDWVIDAFNSNKPFDAFTIEQLAGDLLPEPALDQLIATGFNRNHMINFEGGIIPEEYRVQYVVDRVDTTSTAWLALTMGCAQCHDHKYDPISQREYFQFYAFFNTIAEQGSDGRDGNAVPYIKAPLPEQNERMAALEAEIARLEALMGQPMPEVDAAEREWTAQWQEELETRWSVLEPVEMKTAGEGSSLVYLEDGSFRAEGENPERDTYEILARTDLRGATALRLEALSDETLDNNGPGRSKEGAFVLTGIEVEAYPVNDPSRVTRLKLPLAIANYSENRYPVRNAADGRSNSGWSVRGYGGGDIPATAVFAIDRPVTHPDGTMLRIRLKHESSRRHNNLGRFRVALTADPAMTPAKLGPWYVNGPYSAYDGQAAYETAFEPEKEVNLEATYEDGRQKWVRAIPGYEDGAVHDLFGDVAATYLYRSIESPRARMATLSLGSNDAIKVWLNGEVVHDNNVQRGIQPGQDTVTVTLREGVNHLLMKIVNYGAAYAFYFDRTDEEVGEIPLDIELVLAKSEQSWTDAERNSVRAYFRRQHSPEWRALDDQRAETLGKKQALDAEIPTVMVMQEMDEPRETFILDRGEYDKPTEQVEPGVPAALPSLPGEEPANRLALAQWLVDPAHPLTARVAVNRYWHRYFGTGLVATVEDFGVQGERPSHPELLDWLASEFVRTGWDVKGMQRLIVTSATYRQDSRVRPELLERDPRNRLLARGPRFRLDAEVIRDSALAVSGLLVEDIGGPSVKPYQPPGIWEEVAYGAGFTAQVFQQDAGPALYRRSMYTFWKRQAPPPGMMLFDAPNREACSVIRSRTNTPLQALALMNDPQYVEAARHLAERVLAEAPEDAAARASHTFQLATARQPKAEELEILVSLYEEQRAQFSADPDAARALLAVGDSPWNEALAPEELAAWSTVANLVLNLDEVITKI